MSDSDVERPQPRIRLDYARPHDALAPFTFGYHLYSVEVEDGGTHEDIGYPSWANLRFQTIGTSYCVKTMHRRVDPVPRAAMYGPTSRALFPCGGNYTVVGIGLTPLGWTRWFGGDADRYADRIAPLGLMIGDAAARLELELQGVNEIAPAAAVFDRFLLDRLVTPHRAESSVARLQDILNDPQDWTVAGLAEAMHVEPRKLARLARAHFGFTPKLMLRRTRFLRTLLKLMNDDGRPYVDKIDGGYHDQSHFVRDCRFFMSMSPRSFIQAKRPLHVDLVVKRQLILGAAVRGLGLPAAAGR